ncbi:MAG: tRNA (adenosine(37)-N6)-threonylcarbamoyltransferase complex ATPase subunit type 1 TsaE [Peptoniphilaceae bacterium]|nr:tRNA (adenosine(37)-N6)-threonylcarbamoyltransferase complex ATPase subunit type 1 TsaE [Peptoniphilaceae bacterium]MDY6019347.1 tRNA (adenosine(37)-N6)-threonylcarbamoyltransferase complex ATPase subunit type 1 TsaE [Anaerococcus sp.]
MIIDNLDKMKEFATKLAKNLKVGDVVRLDGDLGAGKTTLVTFIAEFFSIKSVTSPTFSIVNIYEGDVDIYHLDLYRFEDEDEILDIDFENYFYPNHAITFIEWAAKAESYLPEDMINIKIEKLADDKRKITIGNENEREVSINESFSN